MGTRRHVVSMPFLHRPFDEIAAERVRARHGRAAAILPVVEELRAEGHDVVLHGSFVDGWFSTHEDVHVRVRGEVGSHYGEIQGRLHRALRGTNVPLDVLFEVDLGRERTDEVLSGGSCGGRPRPGAGVFARIGAALARVREVIEEEERARRRHSKIPERYRSSSDRTRAAAGAVHDVCVGIEDVLLEVARRVDGGVPTEPRSHADLIDQMTASLPSVRDPVVDDDLAGTLRGMLGFRDHLRRGYGAGPGGVRIEKEWRRSLRGYACIVNATEGLCAEIVGTSDGADGSPTTLRGVDLESKGLEEDAPTARTPSPDRGPPSPSTDRTPPR